MCGICGFAFADLSRPPQRGALEVMSELVRHRGTGQWSVPMKQPGSV